MPNIRIAGANGAKVREVVEKLHHLPDEVIDGVVVTRYLHHPCIDRPMAQIAYSNEVPRRHLELICRAISVAGFAMPTSWRYWPPWPKYPTIEVFMYGLDETMFRRIAEFAHKQDAAFYNVSSIVLDMNRNHYAYAEVRGYPVPDVNGILWAGAVAVQLKDMLDVEVFCVCDGRPYMSFWPKGASGTLGSEESENAPP